MGCFNTTGFISNLPVRNGDRVVCMVGAVLDDFNVRDLWSIDSLVAPWSLPVRGEYDDYGGIEKIDGGPVSDAMSEFFSCEGEFSVDDALNAIAGMHEGSVEIAYEKSAEDSETHAALKHLLPMEEDKLSTPKCKWILLFEHEEVYDEIASIPTLLDREYVNMWKCIKRMEELRKEWRESLGGGSAIELVQPPTWWNSATWDRSMNIFMLGEEAKNEPDPKRREFLEKYAEEMKAFNEELYPRVLSNILSMGLHRHELRKHGAERYLKFVENAREEITKFYSVCQFFYRIPAYFKPSWPGSQTYDLGVFDRALDAVRSKLDEMKEDDEEDREDRGDDEW